MNKSRYVSTFNFKGKYLAVTNPEIGNKFAGLGIFVMTSDYCSCFLRPYYNYSQQLEHPEPLSSPKHICSHLLDCEQ